ncbi:chalcone isomerase family protein [Aquabacterium soli]|nr:chalcone isomerase family protein [Aquabacterium soli]
MRGLAAGRPWCVAALVAVMSGMAGVGHLPGVSQAHAAVLESQRFDDNVVVADRTLRLNGLGLRGVAWIKAFVAGLYVAAPSRDPGQLMAMQGPKRLRLKIMLEAPSKELSKAFSKGVRRNEVAAVQGQLGERMAVFAGLIDSLGTLKVGDALDVDFVPGQGAQLRHNGKAVGEPVAGEDFYRALLKIFIGERPVDARLKEGMLRGRAE